ncbi:F-box/LRR-repeat protein At4g14103-like [Spinacia oleracea]|uniref:F-box/LRR-repeat protein At4g14103-like n=1 Tax=Spinacia oleracea TaxID=3562 RepID=A0ABM3R5K6_SPIOL|nr:F-box/LRR-repeat protein At4g14103-like [Spinacia oleracea]
MDLRLKPFTTSTSTSTKRLKPCVDDNPVVEDRLTSLPDELLIRILSLVPTKDAAATCVLSKKTWPVFRHMISLEFDDSPISHCLRHPYAVERFPSFVNFVDNVLQSYQSQYLTRFCLRMGKDFRTRYFGGCEPAMRRCEKCCLPDLNPTQINAWISFPFTAPSCGGVTLRELELCINVREPGHSQLPPEIFTCQTLEVLKLDVNLGLDLAYTMPSFHLPNLKLLDLRLSFISEESFVSRLVSSCPLLQDLTVIAWFNHIHSMTISSTSLKRLCLDIYMLENEFDNTDFVRIHTPNLEYFKYSDNLALHYSIPNMDRLVKADILMGSNSQMGTLEESTKQVLNFIKPLSNVQHLYLFGCCTEELNVPGVEDQLPVFHNLKYLKLGYVGYTYWDKVLLAFLNRSPVLETLVFPSGISDACVDQHGCVSVVEDDLEAARMERKFCRKTLATIPCCCRSYLKTIVISSYFGGIKREINLIKFLLRHALVLEELIVIRDVRYSRRDHRDHKRLESKLQNLPRASPNCLIQVQ